MALPKIAVLGGMGRMGKAIIAELIAHKAANYIGAFDRNLTADDKIINGLTDDLVQLIKNSDVIIDFSSPQLAIEAARLAVLYKKVFVSGTTGFTQEQKAELLTLSQKTAIFWSPNMSIGVAVLQIAVTLASRMLGDDYDVDIFEIHHKHKVDSPSGTALSLCEAVKHGNKNAEIGFASLRSADVIGEHNVIFSGIGERVELSHKAFNRDIFARGAVRAAIWAADKPIGFYSMNDLLALNN